MRGKAERGKEKKNPIFINMEILPDVKSLEDILVHKLAGPFEHALPADVKYLKCLSCCGQPVLTTQLDKQSATTEDMNLLYERTSVQIEEDQAGKQAETLSPMITLSRKCCIMYSHHLHISYSKTDTYRMNPKFDDMCKFCGKKGGSGHSQAEVLCVFS